MSDEVESITTFASADQYGPQQTYSPCRHLSNAQCLVHNREDPVQMQTVQDGFMVLSTWPEGCSHEVAVLVCPVHLLCEELEIRHVNVKKVFEAGTLHLDDHLLSTMQHGPMNLQHMPYGCCWVTICAHSCGCLVKQYIGCLNHGGLYDLTFPAEPAELKYCIAC